jgi:hypothetical protein
MDQDLNSDSKSLQLRLSAEKTVFDYQGAIWRSHSCTIARCGKSEFTSGALSLTRFTSTFLQTPNSYGYAMLQQLSSLVDAIVTVKVVHRRIRVPTPTTCTE